MESLSNEQLLAEIDQPNERELYAEIQKIGLNGYLLKNTPKEILTKFLPSILCHLQFETWLHRLNSKFNNQQPINQTDNQLIVNIDYNQFDQPTTSGLSSIQITNSNSSNIPPTITVADTNVIQNYLEIQTSSNDQIEEDLWPAVFNFPAEKLDDVLLESLRDVDVILSKKDRSDIVNVLFKQILSYKKLYPSGFQYREAAKSFVKIIIQVMHLNSIPFLYFLEPYLLLISSLKDFAWFGNLTLITVVIGTLAILRRIELIIFQMLIDLLFCCSKNVVENPDSNEQLCNKNQVRCFGCFFID
ncbi:hypothetical protein BpHYR1_025402 [Brachionus plicatilis]|uniref:Uncharacterized protein n=1 Tax=Brachionus plicatilis TaxID=10195 RepID=A0A3M7Q9W6_BRAPC|nr:hypothetical protein BpHYR1_025402 [Brachionus plicatilis]